MLGNMAKLYKYHCEPLEMKQMFYLSGDAASRSD
jgi:hypothetical protein